jgi:hypothetical protein
MWRGGTASRRDGPRPQAFPPSSGSRPVSLAAKVNDGFGGDGRVDGRGVIPTGVAGWKKEVALMGEVGCTIDAGQEAKESGRRSGCLLATPTPL